MRPEFYFYCYPWDLEDDGLENALGRLAGEIGVNGIAVAVATPELVQLRTCSTQAGRWWRSPAGVHFQPHAKFYGNSRIRPVAAAWMKSHNAFDRICRAAEREKLAVRAWMDPLHGEALVDRHPHAAALSVFGDCISNRLCPSQPDVRSYLEAVVTELSSNYHLAAIELEAVHFPCGIITSPHEKECFPLGPLDDGLMLWCFCAACRQRATDAGVDVKHVEAAVKDRLLRSLRLERSPDALLESQVSTNEWLAAYSGVRTATVTSLIRALRSASHKHLYFHDAPPPAYSGFDWSAAFAYCDAAIVRADRGFPAYYQDALKNVKEKLRIHGTLRCYPSALEDGPAVVAAVHRAVQSGISGVGFKTFGVAPEPCLDWVRQAIRYARREAP